MGEKYSPSLSPDGKQLAFAWNGGNGRVFSIYVKLIGTEEPLRLTKQESVDYNPVWSPDGRYIAFCRIQKGETGIYIVPTLGGAERKVRDTHWEEREFYEVFWYFGRLSWSPDGKLLAFSDRTSVNEPTSIFSTYRSIHSQSAESLHQGCRVITTLYFPPMVKHWLSTGVRRGLRPSTRWRLQEERNSVSSPARNTDGD